MFTNTVKAEQEKRGSRETYERIAARPAQGAFSGDEIAFIQSRDSFYLASVSETGWPYVQHRGGPTGFLRVSGPTSLAFADYRGNRQFVSTGNIGQDDRISLILMDYPQKARLKILGHAGIVEVGEDAALAKSLTGDGNPAPERLVTIRVVAFDWNCPKYITPRFTEDEVTALVAPHLSSRDAAITRLADRLSALGENPDALLQKEPPDDSR